MVKVDAFLLSSAMYHGSLPVRKRKQNSRSFDVASTTEAEGSDAAEQPKIHALSLIQRLSIIDLNAPQSQTQKVIEQGEALLSQLKSLQYHLLQGEIPSQTLVTLQKTLQENSEYNRNISTELKNLILDIQVRVAVELAKHNL